MSVTFSPSFPYLAENKGIVCADPPWSPVTELFCSLPGRDDYLALFVISHQPLPRPLLPRSHPHTLSRPLPLPGNGHSPFHSLIEKSIRCFLRKVPVHLFSGPSRTLIVEENPCTLSFARNGMPKSQIHPRGWRREWVVMPPDHLSSVALAAVGLRHTLITDKEDTLYSWGEGAHGKLGHGNTENYEVPTLLFHSFSEITALAVGNECSAFLYQENLYTFGLGNEGELGLGSATEVWRPTLVEELPPLIGVTTHATATFVLDKRGKVWILGGISTPVCEEAKDYLFRPRPLTAPEPIRTLQAGWQSLFCVDEKDNAYKLQKDGTWTLVAMKVRDITPLLSLLSGPLGQAAFFRFQQKDPSICYLLVPREEIGEPPHANDTLTFE